MDPWFLENGRIKDKLLKEIVEAVRERAGHWNSLGIESMDTQAWVYGDEVIDEWVMLHVDIVADNKILRTLRVDVDRARVRGGISPGSLDWDEGMRAEDAGIDTRPPDGLEESVKDYSVSGIAERIVSWLEAEIGKGVPRRPRP